MGVRRRRLPLLRGREHQPPLGIYRLAERTRSKGSITKEAQLVAVSPHVSTLASELLSNFPEVMLHPASLPGRSVRYALADLVLLMPKPPTVLQQNGAERRA